MPFSTRRWEAEIDSEWDVADSHPRDPWIALLIVMFTLAFLHMIGIDGPH